VDIEIPSDLDDPFLGVAKFYDPAGGEPAQAPPDARKIALGLLPEPDELEKEIARRGGHLREDMEEDELHPHSRQGREMAENPFRFA
jgi:hypothetical protein